MMLMIIYNWFIGKFRCFMERYFYHGIGDSIDCDTLESMLVIMESGILKSRNAIGYSGDDYNHVCLYRCNELYDYSGSGLEGTALDGWINNSFCFIVSPSIVASKTSFYYSLEDENNATFTDLVDEWRSDGDIPLDRVIGIGMPLDDIREQRCIAGSGVDEYFDEKLTDILLFAESMDWLVVNSNDSDFTTRLDDVLNSGEVNKYI